MIYARRHSRNAPDPDFEPEAFDTTSPGDNLPESTIQRLAPAPAVNQVTESAAALLPRLAEMMTSLCAKRIASVQSVCARLEIRRENWTLEALEEVVHSLCSAVSALTVSLAGSGAESRQAEFARFSSLSNETWSAGEALLREQEADGSSARKLAVDISLEATVMQSRLLRAEAMARVIRNDIAARRCTAAPVAQAALDRLAERERAESAQLAVAKQVHACAAQAGEAFRQRTEARARLAAQVQIARAEITALHDALLPLLDSEAAVDRMELAPLRELADQVFFTLVQAGAEVVRMQVAEQAVAAALATIQRVPSGR